MADQNRNPQSTQNPPRRQQSSPSPDEKQDIESIDQPQRERSTRERTSTADDRGLRDRERGNLSGENRDELQGDEFIESDVDENDVDVDVDDEDSGR